MKKPSAVITGATGFIGSHLTQLLLANGWSVSLLVRESSVSKLTDIQKKGVRIIADSSDDISGLRLSESLRGTDVVFHLASLFLASHQPADVPRLIESNILFGARLLEAMKTAGVTRLVNTGTAWQHFENEDLPVNLYAATKTAFQALIDFYTAAGALRCVTLKLYDTYGPRDPRAKLIHILMKAARSGESIGLSPGEQKIDLTHVSDVAAAFEVAAQRLLTSGNPAHERFVVGTGRPVSLKKLVTDVEISTGLKINAKFGERPYRDREVMIPYSKGTALPGWSPKVSLHDGLKETFEALSE